MGSKSINDYKKTYSKPGLRTKLKEKILKNTKGGKAGQWTARKAQLLVKEYEKNSGGYKKNSKTQRSRKSLNSYNEKAKKELSSKNLTSKTFKPTLKIVKNVTLGLKLHKQFKRGGTTIGIKRAIDLKNQKSISLNILKRMHNYFARHEIDKKSKNFGSKNSPSPGYIAWLLWGGDDAQIWVKQKLGK